MKQYAIVIVTYQSAVVIEECLKACLALARGISSIVVVDNASTDHTVEEVRRFPEVLLIANSQNRGFAAACNQGAAAIQSPYLLFLNPDAILLTGIEPLRRACLRPGVAGATGQLLDEEGQFQSGFAVRRLPTPLALTLETLGINRLWPTNPINRAYRCLGFDARKPQPVEQPPGAFLCLRRDVWDLCHGMDEDFYPLWFEDVDLCRRIRNEGYLIEYRPEVRVRHQGAHSAGKLSESDRPVYWYGSLLRYAAKHFNRGGRALVSFSVLVKSLLRVTIDSVRSGDGVSLAAYRKVMRLGWYHLVTGRRETLLPSSQRPLSDSGSVMYKISTPTES